MRAMLSVRRRPLLVLGMILAAACPATAVADCAPPGFAAPAVAEFSAVAAQEYFDAAVPADADEKTKQKAADQAITSAQADWVGVVTNTVADAFARSAEAPVDESIATARAIAEHMNEAARTDKQVGASASVSGSTSAMTKTGIPRILSLAIENGAVQREDNGTSATLSTSPYALLLLGEEDTDKTFNDHSHLRRLGVSATLDLDESNSTGSGDFKADQISAVSTNLRLYGDRSARTTAFFDQWYARVAPRLRKNAEDGVQRDLDVLRNSPALLTLATRLDGEVRAALRAALILAEDEEKARKAVAETLQTKLCALIVDPIASGGIDVSGFDSEAIVTSAAREIMSLNAARTELDALLNEVNSQPVVTFQHTWNRSDEGSDYSALVLAADGMVSNVPYSTATLPLAPLTILFNAALSFNHNPDENIDQETIREYGLSGSLEKSMANPLRIGNQAEGATRMSFSLTGRYTHQKDADADIGIVHGRVAVPLVRGFSLVVALNYASRSETDSKDEVRLAGGLEFNGDTLAELADLQALFEQRR